MRIPSSVFAVGRYALALVAITGSVVLMSAPKKTAFTPHDKAYYASEATVNFVRPGLTMKIVSANIAQDGTISVDYKITDPKGLPLDPARYHHTGRCLGEFPLRVHSERADAVFLLHDAHADQPDHQSDGDSGRRGFRRDHQDRWPTANTSTPSRPRPTAPNSAAWDPTADAPHRHLRFAQPDRVRSGHELR